MSNPFDVAVQPHSIQVTSSRRRMGQQYLWSETDDGDRDKCACHQRGRPYRAGSSVLPPRVAHGRGQLAPSPSLRSPASKRAKTLGRGEFHVSAVQNWRLISFSQGQLFFISFKISQDTHRSPNGVSGHTTVVIKSESSHACLLAHCYQQSDDTDGCT